MIERISGMKKKSVTVINSANDKFQILKSLKENRKKRSMHKEIFIEGIESIKQAVSSNARVKKMIFSDYHSLSDWAKELIERVAYEELIQLKKALYQTLSDKDNPSELIITIDYMKYTLDDITLNGSPFLLIIDRPGSYGNLGSIIRSANSFGVDVIITSGHGVDIYNPKVIRSSLGALFHTKTFHVESLVELEEWITFLKNKYQIQVIGTDSAGEVSILDYEIKRPVILIIGNEAKGMSVRFKQLADKIVRIPIEGAVNSLNAACAGSILLWQIFKNSRKAQG